MSPKRRSDGLGGFSGISSTLLLGSRKHITFHNTYLLVLCLLLTTRHFSVIPYITICPSTETYFALCLRGAMSVKTGIYLFRLLLNIIFFALRSLP